MNRGFTDRLAKIEKRLGGIETRLDGTGNRVDGIGNRFTEMLKRLDAVEYGLQELQASFLTKM